MPQDVKILKSQNSNLKTETFANVTKMNKTAGIRAKS